MDMPHEHTSSSPDQTEHAGATLGRCLEPGDVIGLIGDLGAGKTLLVQGVARGLGVPPDVRVTSPTFTIINEYHGGRLSLYHADLYRIEQARELEEIGLDDICRRADGVVCVEWSDRFDVLGRDVLHIRLQVSGRPESEGDSMSQERSITFEGTGARSRALAADWADHL
jgi:tRNA threonylcarbamoyladenosine biosynthesis protein TsaE